MAKLVIFLIILGLLAPVGVQPAQALDVPSLITPYDGANITAVAEPSSLAMPPLAIPEFSWSPVEGAATYRIQFSQDIAFTTRVEFTTPATRFTPINANTLSDGEWFWRVRADTPAPAGEFSDTWSFTREWASDQNYPVLVSPEDGANLEFFDAPVFQVAACHRRSPLSFSSSGIA